MAYGPRESRDEPKRTVDQRLSTRIRDDSTVHPDKVNSRLEDQDFVASRNTWIDRVDKQKRDEARKTREEQRARGQGSTPGSTPKNSPRAATVGSNSNRSSPTTSPRDAPTRDVPSAGSSGDNTLKMKAPPPGSTPTPGSAAAPRPAKKLG